MTDMFRLAIAIWYVVFQSAKADLCSQEYDIAHGCDQTYGDVIETLDTVTSTMQCLMHCNEHDRCLSVKQDVTNKVCQLNSERFISMSTNCLTMLDYAQPTKRSCRKLINQNCASSSECSVTNSQCYLNKCRCDPGYSFKYVNESCVPSCDAYGSTFTVYYGYILSGNNQGTWNVQTREDCEQLCTKETAFTCRSVDYIPSGKFCHLSKQTALTKPEYYMSAPGIYYIQRNCQ